MNEYICPKCRERSYSAASLETLINKNCEKCGTPVKAAERGATTPRSEKIKLASLLTVLPGDTSLFIIEYIGPHKYEGVFEGLAREALSSAPVEKCGESVVLQISPEIDDTASDDLTIPVLVLKVGRKGALRE